MLWVDPAAAHWPEIARRTILVSIGDGIAGADTAVEVVFDNDVGVRAALGQLADAGHRHIAVLTPSPRNTPDTPAEQAIRSGVGRARPADQPAHDAVRARRRGRGRPRRADRRPTGPPRSSASPTRWPTASTPPRGELGVAIPDDVSVLGYDDDPVSRLLTPPLSNFRWPVDVLVSHAVERTIRAIDEDKYSRRKLLTPVAQPRGSVAAPPTATRGART